MQCSTQYLMDKETHKLVSMAKKVNPCEIDVPWYLWKYEEDWVHRVAVGFEKVGDELLNTFSIMKKTHTVELNALSIEFTQEYKHANIRFFDSNKGMPVKLELDANQNLVVSLSSSNRKYRDMKGIGYQVKIDGVAQTYYCDFATQVKEGPRFKWVGGLGHPHMGDPLTKRFCYGFVPVPYQVMYKGRELGGNSYAMICGPWAILLDDDYSFDSLVFLKALKGWDMEVERFVYTTNTYVLKVMTLWK